MNTDGELDGGTPAATPVPGVPATAYGSPVAAKPGAPRDFEARVDDLFRIAWRAAFKVLGDRTSAEDVAEEALIRAYTRWSTVAGHAEPWVTRVACNLAISQWRRNTVAADALPLLGTATVTVADASIDRLDLTRAVASLSRRQREVITLRYLLDMPESEVAKVLDCSEGSVSRHTTRALGHLRERLTGYAMEVTTNV
jgi:RNA polymerase sigma-70 factor (ECF subfamily)